MCDSSSCPRGPTAAAVMVTSMAVLTTSVTCRTAQGCLGTICLNITHVHTHTPIHTPSKRDTNGYMHRKSGNGKQTHPG